MIFIQYRWILVIGEALTKTIELYNIEDGIIIVDSHFNEERTSQITIFMLSVV